MTAAELLTRAAVILHDTDHVRWPLSELVDWINDAQRAIVLAKPSANPQTVNLDLIRGTRQSLTDPTHLCLLRLPRNILQIDPVRGGRAIRPVTREQLDTSSPYWHDPVEVPYRKEVRQYVFDEANPREFYVYPGNDATGIVEAVVSVLPTAVVPADDGDANDIASYESVALGLSEPYAVVILDYVLYRAFSKDDMPADNSRAQIHYQAFATALGVKIQAEAANSPNSRAKVSST